jgi:hypothetical protein
VAELKLLKGKKAIGEIGGDLEVSKRNTQFKM